VIHSTTAVTPFKSFLLHKQYGVWALVALSLINKFQNCKCWNFITYSLAIFDQKQRAIIQSVSTTSVLFVNQFVLSFIVYLWTDCCGTNGWQLSMYLRTKNGFTDQECSSVSTSPSLLQSWWKSLVKSLLRTKQQLLQQSVVDIEISSLYCGWDTAGKLRARLSDAGTRTWLLAMNWTVHYINVSVISTL